MAYRLSLCEEVPAGIARVLHEELRGAVARLEAGGGDPVAAVHGARKSLKKCRALIRLARPGVGREVARRENRALAEVAGSIAGLRDGDVMVATLGGLREGAQGRVPPADFDELLAGFEREAAERRGFSSGATAGDVPERLRAIDARVDELSLQWCTWATLAEGVTTAYARGVADLGAARESPGTQELHEWRKRVKDLWYHHRLLTDAWPPMFTALADELHVLSEALGDDHDLSLLAERLETDHAGLPELIAERRAELQRRALALGALVYAERPKAFGRRIRRYLP